eukprot:8919193-Prorocentrum_lima.AAC.1
MSIFPIKHIHQYLSSTWQWCSVMQPHQQQYNMTIVSDASLAPVGGRRHVGCHDLAWSKLSLVEIRKQSLTAVPS